MVNDAVARDAFLAVNWRDGSGTVTVSRDGRARIETSVKWGGYELVVEGG